MAVEIRTIVEDELQAYIEASRRGFGSDIIDGEHDRIRQLIGLDRTHAAFHGSRIVGTMASYSLELAVPGEADVATAGLTRVTVSATHRRRGLLSAMMAVHFEDAEAHHEPLSALWASEIPIYGRYGYGQATEQLDISFDARLAGIRRPDHPDDLEPIDGDEAAALLPELREQVRGRRPGRFRRNKQWWELRTLADPEDWRDGASSLRYVVAKRQGRAVGYASYRQKQSWSDLDLPQGKIQVADVVGIDLRASHTMWWFLANIDLFPNVSSWSQPTDTILPALASNPRAIGRRLSDGIHLRILDVEAALGARRYEPCGDLTFELVDDRRPALSGAYRLSVDDGGVGACSRDDAEPLVRLSPVGLGALYLGSAGPEALAVAGHLTPGPSATEEEVSRSLRRLFGWPTAAWCDEGF